jgi:outer membrane protein assembly factor BamB
VIVAVGGAGRVYCLDADTGEPRWQRFLPSHARWTEEAAAGKPAGGRARPHAVTIVAGNALVADEGGGLMAFRLADGSLAWHAKNVLGNQATPNVWQGDGVTLVLSQFDRSEGCPVSAIDPETGETLWQIEDLPEHPYKMASNFLMGDTLIVPGYLSRGVSQPTPSAASGNLRTNSQGSGAGGGNAERPQSITAYHVSARGAKKIWELPASRYQINTHVGQGAMVALDDHRVAMYSTWHRTPTGQPVIWVVDIRSGEVVWEKMKPEEHVDWGGSGDFASCGDRLIKQVDPSHQSQQYHGWHISDDGLKRLWTGERFGPMEATSYEVPLVNPFVDGRLIVRHAFGIYCYDLRAPQ